MWNSYDNLAVPCVMVFVICEFWITEIRLNYYSVCNDSDWLYSDLCKFNGIILCNLDSWFSVVFNDSVV